jgi:hypothetical protein
MGLEQAGVPGTARVAQPAAEPELELAAELETARVTAPDAERDTARLVEPA